MAKKAVAAKKTKKDPIVDTMGKAIAAFLDTQGWNACTIGPCEVRVVHAYNNNQQKTGDATGRTLAQYEFIVKFYGHKRAVCEEK